MNQSYFSQELDQRAILHLRHELSYTYSLGQLFAGSTRLEQGHIFAMLPSGEIGDPYRFKESIVRDNPMPKIPTPGGYVQAVVPCDTTVSRWLENVFSRNPTLALVCESLLRRAGHKRAEDPGRTLEYRDSLYYVAVQGDEPAVRDECLGLILAVPPSFGIIWSTGEVASTWIHRGIAMDEELERAIVDKAQALLIGAYDGDSFLVWVPQGTTIELPDRLDS